MRTFDHAHFVINETFADEYVKQHMTPLKVTQALADAGLLAPAPQIIRTLDELEALDPETLCVTSMFGNVFPAMVLHKRPEHAMPAAVVASGAQVRAARTALQEVTEWADRTRPPHPQPERRHQ